MKNLHTILFIKYIIRTMSVWLNLIKLIVLKSCYSKNLVSQISKIGLLLAISMILQSFTMSKFFFAYISRILTFSVQHAWEQKIADDITISMSLMLFYINLISNPIQMYSIQIVSKDDPVSFNYKFS